MENDTKTEVIDQPRSNQIARRTFDGMALAHENAATQALIAKATADTQSRFIMAMRNPRNMLQVRQDVMLECKRPGFAEAAIYKLPRGGKEIRGLTIRFAEVAMRCFGNMSCEAQTLYDSDEERLVRVTTIDYETNATWQRDITIKKTKEVKQLKNGERAIRSRPNSFGDIVHLVAATDDDMRMKEGAEISRAARTAILRLVPGHIQDEAEELCEQLIVADAKTRLEKDPDGEKNRMLDAFATLSVSAVDVEVLLGHKLDRISPAELADLKLTFQAIRAGEISVQEALALAGNAKSKTPATRDAKTAPANGNGPASQPPVKPDEPPEKATGGKGAQATKDKIKAEKARAAPVEQTPTTTPSEPVKDGYEVRSCAACGVTIEVPVSDPPNAQCYACSQSE